MAVINGTSGADSLLGTTAIDTISGFDDADTLSGGNSNDLLIGGLGADSLSGGAGTADIASYQDAASAVSVNLATGVHTGEAAGDTFSTVEIYQGSAFADTFTSSAAVETFRGGAGDDLYIVNAATDLVTENAASGTDEVQASSSTYTLGANLEALTYIGAGNFSGVGNSGDNTLTGGGGNDTLQGGAGADSFVGGSGTDMVTYATGVSVNLTTGVHTGQALGDTFSSIEILQGSTTHDTLTGDAGANNLQGSSGNDLIEGGAGADTLDGGAGTDIASYASATSGVSVNLITGLHAGDAAGDVITTFEIYQGSAFADTFTSSAAVQTFRGGDGNDLYILDQATDVVTEVAAAGTDEVQASSATYTLAANLDLLTYIGAGNFSGVGNDGDNTLTGGGGHDTLRGEGGADSFVGGAGNDLVSYAAGTAINLNLATGVHTNDALGDSFSGIETLLGSNQADTLTGDAAANAFQGALGNDLIEGGAGADTLDGGAGTDTASYASATSGVSVNLISGLHAGDAAGDVITTFEIYQGSAFADTFTSSAAVETFRGGAGSDLYIVDQTTDVVTEAVGEGDDEVRTTAASYTLGANVETLTYTGAGAFSGIGNAVANLIASGGGNDTLQGGAGADTLDAGSGSDLLAYTSSSSAVTLDFATGTHTGDAAGDLLIGFESFQGSNLADRLIGAAGGDVLLGGSGNDLLEGGAGADTLDGGAGAFDIVTYANAGAAMSLDLSTGTYSGEGAGDVLTGFEVFQGTAFDDTMVGGAANENFLGGVGADLFTGGGGSNGLWYITSSASVAIDLSTGQALNGDAAGDVYSGIRNVWGTSFDDILFGDTQANSLVGGGGDDTLIGGNGSDAIYSGDHDDAFLATALPISRPAWTTDANYVEGGLGNDSIFGGGQDTGSLFDGGDGDDFIRGWSDVTVLGGSGADTINMPGANGLILGEAGNDLIRFQGSYNLADLGDGSDTYMANFGEVSFAEDSGASGTDVVWLSYATSSATLLAYYDAGTDQMLLTTTIDRDDGDGIDQGVWIQNWSLTSSIERLYANDGSFISI